MQLSAARRPRLAFPRASHRGQALAAALGLILLAALLALLPFPLAVLLPISAAGALAMLRRPWLVWLLPAAALPLGSSIPLGPLTVTDLLLGLAVFVWLISGATRRSLRTTHHALLLPLMVYLSVLALSLLNAQDLVEATKEVVKWIGFAGVLMLVPSMVDRPQARWLVMALILAAAGQALLGLYQFAFRIGPEWFVLFDRFMRASGSFRQPNPFAGYLGLTLPVVLSLSLWGLQTLASQHRTRAAVAWTLAYLTAACVIAAGLVASWSRGAWLGALTGAVTVLLFYSRRSALLVVGAGLALLIAALIGALSPAWVPSGVTDRLQDLPAYFGLVDVLDQPVTDENFAVVERIAHWVAALRMAALAPWLGVGPGNYEAVYPLVRLPVWEEPLGHAHNIYLNVLAETGLIGLSAFLLLWGSAVHWVWQALHKPTATGSEVMWERALAVGVMGVLAHLAVHSFFDNLFVQGIYLHLAFWLAAAAASDTLPAAEHTESETAT